MQSTAPFHSILICATGLLAYRMDGCGWCFHGKRGGFGSAKHSSLPLHWTLKVFAPNSQYCVFTTALSRDCSTPKHNENTFLGFPEVCAYPRDRHFWLTSLIISSLFTRQQFPLHLFGFTPSHSNLLRTGIKGELCCSWALLPCLLHSHRK